MRLRQQTIMTGVERSSDIDSEQDSLEHDRCVLMSPIERKRYKRHKQQKRIVPYGRPPTPEGRIRPPCREEWLHRTAWRCRAFAQSKRYQCPFLEQRFPPRRHPKDLHRRRPPCISCRGPTTRWGRRRGFFR